MAAPLTIDMTGRKVLVTGAASGIGRTISSTLARCGADIVVNSRRDRLGAETIAAEIRASGGKASVVLGDISKFQVASRVVRQSAEVLGGLDTIVNNVGPFAFTPLSSLDSKKFDDLVQGNLNSSFYVSKAAMPYLRRAGGSVIVNLGLATVNSLSGGPGVGPYAVAKAALTVLTRSMAAETASSDIRVVMVSPGLIDTENLSPKQRAWMKARVPSGRLGKPQEVANAVAFLTSDLAVYTSGAVLSVSGGWAWDEDRSTRHDHNMRGRS